MVPPHCAPTLEASLSPITWASRQGLIGEQAVVPRSSGASFTGTEDRLPSYRRLSVLRRSRYWSPSSPLPTTLALLATKTKGRSATPALPVEVPHIRISREDRRHGERKAARMAKQMPPHVRDLSVSIISAMGAEEHGAPGWRCPPARRGLDARSQPSLAFAVALAEQLGDADERRLVVAAPGEAGHEDAGQSSERPGSHPSRLGAQGRGRKANAPL